MRISKRHFALPLLWIATPLVLLASAYGQSVEEDDAEFLATTASQADHDTQAPDVVEAIVQRTNEFRREQGRRELQVNPALTEAAQYFADYMARTDRYGHRADGKTPSGRAQNAGYDFCLVSENIAYQYNSAGFEATDLATRLVTGWIDSPPHRESMLDPDVREIGVAVSRSETTGHWYGVQMFGRPKSAAVEFKIENRSNSSVEYTVAGRTFTLPPRYIRTHIRCRPVELVFGFRPGRPVKPGDESHYTITGDSGELELSIAEPPRP